MLERRDLIGINVIATIVFAGVCFVLAHAIRVQGALIDRTAPMAFRLGVHCDLVRLQLADELKQLFSTTKTDRSKAVAGFEGFEGNDWREIALCAPPGVQIVNGCSTDDVPCMAAATANAVLMTGAK